VLCTSSTCHGGPDVLSRIREAAAPDVVARASYQGVPGTRCFSAAVVDRVGTPRRAIEEPAIGSPPGKTCFLLNAETSAVPDVDAPADLRTYGQGRD